ncbi:hypothetical protein [Streptomyces sp. ODS05-4]|uniref:hypothetical protein n=1 Tax=Streptomyces sp. ODS05-4 TaxID=2944939 RepID=UPI00210C708E|nr:hypothetical protein [Streptomyces sp. ODS05-4]
MSGIPGAGRRVGDGVWLAGQVVLALGVVLLIGVLMALDSGSGEFRETVVWSMGVPLLVAVVVVAAIWPQERRKARHFGLTTARWQRIAREVGRGRPPADPSERPAALDVIARQRRGLSRMHGPAYRWMRFGALALFLIGGGLQWWDGEYVRAAWSVGVAAIWLLVPLSLRRRARNLDAVERALGAPAGGTTGGVSAAPPR